MSQNFNEEFIGKISAAIDAVESTVIVNVNKAREQVVEMAEATGSDKFTKSAQSLYDGTGEMVKSAQELLDVLRNVKTQYEKLNNALN